MITALGFNGFSPQTFRSVSFAIDDANHHPASADDTTQYTRFSGHVSGPEP